METRQGRVLSNLVDFFFFFFRKPEIGIQSCKEKLYHVGNGIHSRAGVLCSFTVWLKVVSEEVECYACAITVLEK